MTVSPASPARVSAARLEVIVPNFKSRFTGVSATVLALVPIQARTLAIAVCGFRMNPAVPHVDAASVILRGGARPGGRPFRIWHARRNSEMLAGLVLKHVLRQPLKLVFTSAAIRRHSPLPRRLIAGMDAVIATTPEAARLVPNVTATIPHGIDTQKFSPPVDKQRAWSAAGLPGQFGILTVGRVRPEKGTDLFVEALCRLLPQFPDCAAAIAGHTAPEFEAFRTSLQRRIAEAGLAHRILWLGHVDAAQIAAWYQRSLIVAAPARYEGFGLTVLEAMASGCAVIASRTGTYPSVIEHERTGRLMKHMDVESLVAELQPLMADAAATLAMGRAARQIVEAGHRVEDEAAAINRVYESLWAGRTVRPVASPK